MPLLRQRIACLKKARAAHWRMEKTGYNRWLELEKEANEAIHFSRSAFSTLKARDAVLAAILRLLVVILKIMIHSHKKL